MSVKVRDMYTVVKSGVYLQDVWLCIDLEEAVKIFSEQINNDDDSYHDWEIVRIKQGESLTNGEILLSQSKPTDSSVVTLEMVQKLLEEKSE